MIISCDNLTKSYGDRVLFSNLSFSLEKNERLCIVGRNGCGKSTLLKIISGIEDYDDGRVRAEDIKISYLTQQVEGLDTRSGGERTRDEIEKVFDEKPSLLLLDEPTNHLDMQGIEWLESKIASFRGAIILVSHDRFLIDRVATKILDLNTVPYKLYKGNYSAYVEQKSLIKLSAERFNKKREDKIKHEKAVIEKLKSFNREKSIKRAESREKLLAKIEGPVEFKDQETEINMVLTPGIESGKDVLFVNELGKSFGDKVLFNNASFDIRKGEHIGLIGGNGTGKTTIFKIILGDEKPDEGYVKIGTNVSVGFYDQNLCIIDDKKSVFDEIHDEYPYMTETEVRNTLAGFAFFNEDVFKKVGMLSGGEKGRLSLCKLMLSDSNFLLLDEPTNHLDMESREILEDALNRYTGTVLYISHDRYFLNKCSDRILELWDEKITNYLGNYDEYINKKADLIEKGYIRVKSEAPVSSPEPKEISEGRLSWQEEKAKKAAEEKRKRDEEKAIKRIEEIDEEIAEIDEEINLPENASNHVKLRELMERREELEAEINNLYELL